MKIFDASKFINNIHCFECLLLHHSTGRALMYVLIYGLTIYHQKNIKNYISNKLRYHIILSLTYF